MTVQSSEDNLRVGVRICPNPWTSGIRTSRHEHAPETEPWDDDETVGLELLTLAGAVGRQGLIILLLRRVVSEWDNEQLALSA